MLFIGIDLAWSSKNSSGAAVIKGNKTKGKVIFSDIVHSEKEIIDFVNNNVKKENAFIAIDAPLIVPNKTGRRIAEVEVGRLFRKYNAGAHPANSVRLGSFNGGKVRGEVISKLLGKNNFKHSPFIKKLEQSRKFFEVYPHPSMVVLFNLKSVLKYKNKPKRDYNFRWNEFRKYQNYFKKLKNPSIIIPKEISDKKLKGLKGGALKNYEDKLDAIFCAYIAYYCWLHPEKCKVLGNMKKGYILTPVF
ncbi:hypothetical protein A2999_03025 [Candidatus Wolfebacteria bacterium RIFCSPLOWO2_01_FULL_38_11]|uniref:DUF429 domain-containing protein n=2 Tax=Candidatus Wolfeibacteriota TaxID=1752735 RepID=A0A0G0FUF1_9BACT|nr:MAG: hypothetical protein US36_C0018G0005 [Candidatus Wolfebacteria bacterium GW2011_GWC1_37_10]OGM90525.1 MAG: hypothetical protein A2999_03025 [Candidatus Wolfebacteria bacterium RIFCSPLOWO2_01_FULL_38_11]